MFVAKMKSRLRVGGAGLSRDYAASDGDRNAAIEFKTPIAPVESLNLVHLKRSEDPKVVAGTLRVSMRPAWQGPDAVRVIVRPPGAMNLGFAGIRVTRFPVGEGSMRSPALDGNTLESTFPGAFARFPLPSRFGCAWMPRALGGSMMRNSKVAMLAYVLAASFILIVAFRSPAKLLVTAEAPAPTTIFDAK